ncbi:MAG: SRPBCC domain-containing protein [Myxococcota bacterium]
MSTRNSGAARAIADLSDGKILATVEIGVPPERVYRALTSEEITKWWGSDDLYRTTEFSAELRVGGKWRAAGKGADGRPFEVRGEYLELDPPRKVVQTWQPDFAEGAATKVTYLLDAIPSGTRVTLRHEGFSGRPEACQRHASGWERVLGWLIAHLVPAAAPPASQFFMCRLLPPRPTFPMDMTESERQIMQAHVAYWTQKLAEKTAILFGPVLDPKGAWGLGVVRVPNEAALNDMTANDPALLSGIGFKYEVLPMPNAVFRD